MAILVREAEVADAGAIATSHVRSWQVGYANVISGELLRGLGSELAQRTLWWQTIILGAEAETASCSSSSSTMNWRVGWVRPCRDAKPDEPLGEVIGCYVDPAHWRKVSAALSWRRGSNGSRDGYQLAVLWVLTTTSVHGRSTNTKAGSRTGAEDVRDGGERYPRCVTDFRWPERAQPRPDVVR